MSISLMVPAILSVAAMAVPTPDWEKDYGKALARGRTENRPLAVFINQGEAGWQGLSKSEHLSQDVRKLLSEKYICVYVDRHEMQGRELARRFDAKSKPALVISSKDGKHQVYRKKGAVSNSQLERVLTQHSTPTRRIIRTNYQPVRSEPVIAPASFSPTPSFGGGTFCPT